MTTNNDPRTSMPYSEFVTTTFAYASKNFFLESFQAIGADKQLSLDCSYGDHLEEHNTILQEENRSLRDLGSAYQAQIDELCQSLDRLHVGLALAGEAMEFLLGMSDLSNKYGPAYTEDDINKALNEVLKEIGDLFYYCQMLSNLYDLGLNLNDPETWDVEPKSCNETQFQFRVEKLVDYIKRVEVYHQDYNPVLMGDNLFDLVEALHHIALNFHTAPLELVQQNRDKLIKRYSSGSFSTQESAAKADAHPSTPSNPA